jgi:NTE family protein
MFNIFKKKYGLALGSGGAKGLVHIGVIKALEELDIKITHIAGSSAGSLIGGSYALWGDIKKVEDIVLGFKGKDIKKMFTSDIGLKKGLFKGDSALEILDEHLGDAKLSDCRIPFVAVSVDILTGKKIYHTEGFLKDALMASSSIPLVFKPYELNGRYLVDGGLAETVPVEAVKSIGAKKVIGVDIEGVPKSTNKLNLKTLSTKIYNTAFYYQGIKDLRLADKKLQFDLEQFSTEELMDNAEEYIQMGYDETMKLFT